MTGRIYAFDGLRFVLAVCVVFGHTFINLYMDGHCPIIVQNLAVDGFFVLSGFLLAMSCMKLWNSPQSSADLFWDSTRRRVQRLYPEYVFAIVFVIAMSVIFGLRMDLSVLPYNLMMISQINGVPGIVNGSWYVSVLFWVGGIYAALLIWGRMGAVRFAVPLIVMLAFCYCYTVCGHLTLHGTNSLVSGWISPGVIKGFLAIGAGILTYFVCCAIKNNPPKLRPRVARVLPLLFESIAIVLLIYCFTRNDTTRLDFLVYAAYPVLIGIYYFRRETITKFLAWPKLAPITDLAYMLFLTHVVVLEVIRRHITYAHYPRAVVYVLVIVLCVAIAWGCRSLQKLLARKISENLFISGGR